MEHAQIYLRDREGESIGPLPMRALEVLFDARVVDEGTPVSENGVTFRALRDFPDMFARVLEVKDMLVRGEDPWSAPLPPASKSSARATTPPLTNPVEGKRPLAAMLRAATDKANGILTMSSVDGELYLHYKDGKIVVLETTVPLLSLPRYLVDTGVADESSVDRAMERAPAMGGDLGGALISLGLVQPHTYFEKFLGWAKQTIGSVIVPGYESVSLKPKDVPSPPVPLGFDRFGVLIEMVRAHADRGWLNEHLGSKRNCPLILSQVEGAKLEDMKLKATELRAINAINGVKTLGEILDGMGGSEQKTLEIFQVVYFAIETGFVVLGADPLINKEIQEAAKLRDALEKLKRKNYFEILSITEKSSDDDVRARYADLVKQHHPDGLRAGAAEELVAVRGEMFALIVESFEAMTTENQRLRYAQDLEQGRAGGSDDLAKVQQVLQAETLFKKAEVLAKLKKLDEALEMLDEAIKLKGDDTEFKVYRVYYGFMHSQRHGGGDETEAEKTIKQILALMKTDSNIAAGYMFLGQLYKLVGKGNVAVKYFERVLEYDEKNAEAAREVRLFNMRAEKDKKKKWF